MTRIQLVIVLALVAIIAAISIPRAVKLSQLSKAEHYALTISSAFKQYKADTGKECTSIENLLDSQGVSGWLGPYISEKVTKNPWGGTFAVDQKNKKIGIPKGDKAPDKYEFGGSEEISFSYDSPELTQGTLTGQQ
ncbi:MAG: type II secretion system protein GspG [Candidatus Poribacteria bacterium]